MPPLDVALYLGLVLTVIGLCVAELVWIKTTARRARRRGRGFEVRPPP